MSKYNLEAPFTAFSGKVCKHSKIIFKKLRQTNFTSQICNPRTKPFSEAELARQSKFRSAAAATKTALADPTTRATYEAEYKVQSKYKSLRGFVIAKEYQKLA
jgi:hypothetical protein